ncbi:hypothetical protein C5F64_12430 [Photobacterium damselae subsp. damselae]|nr:hypothetical protein BST98_21445 [Photobacterium damselae]PSB85298.1 hypothetical protein C5F64_12430 [Photobacterium damselae subsp. damselae]
MSFLGFCKCPSCSKTATTGEGVYHYDISFDFCPHCFYLVSNGYEYDTTISRVYLITIITELFDCKSVAALRKKCGLKTDTELVITTFNYVENLTKLGSLSPFQKLGGLHLFYTDPCYKRNYDYLFPSVKQFVKEEMQNLQETIRLMDEKMKLENGISFLECCEMDSSIPF